MDCKKRHEKHDHVHGATCGHTSIRHGNEVAYLHDGHLHVAHGDHYDCVAIKVDAQNPGTCTPQHSCVGHGTDHKHGSHCGHEQVPHGDHVDYLVGDHLHHVHGNHCDSHGHIEAQRSSKAAV